MAGEEERVENGGRKKAGEVKKGGSKKAGHLRGRRKKAGEIWREKMAGRQRARQTGGNEVSGKVAK